MINPKKTISIIDEGIDNTELQLSAQEVSTVYSISSGTAVVRGLKSVQMDEILQFPNGVLGFVQTLKKDNVGVVFLSNADSVKAGDKVVRTKRVLDVPVSENLLGRVINPLGEPLDNKGPIAYVERRPIEVEAAAIMDRAPVNSPLQTGIKAIDAFTPIGKGQRELILGDRQTGKTAIAIDTIINQKNSDVICIYCAIGMQNSAVAKVIADFKRYKVMDNVIVVVSAANDEAGMQYVAPYAATSIGEYFMKKGKDVLVVYDDLTNHARAYRQVSLLLRRPPGREAFPGDVFYIHSRLLERSTHLSEELGGGSLTALPIVSTEAGNISAYIPTNIISITDGQIYLSAQMFQKGIMPAVDTGRSVSRVGGDAQLSAYKSLVGPLKLFYSQFEELESFTKFGTQLDKETLQRINRGKAIRFVLEQRQYHLMSASDQIAVFIAVNNGLFDGFSLQQVRKAETMVLKIYHTQFTDYIRNIELNEKLTPSQIEKMITAFRQVLQDEVA